MVKNNVLPFGAAAERLMIKQPAAQHRGHFLSIIAFDGNITMQTFQSALEGMHAARLWLGWKLHAGEGQGRSRNECAHQFLHATPAEFHDICDADIMFKPAHWQALRRHPEAKNAIICGAYPKKQDKVEFCLNTLKEDPKPNAAGLMEIAKGGTGFMQIPRNVYERMREAYPEDNYVCDYVKGPKGEPVIKHGFFCERIMLDTEVGFVRHLTEDWMFCYKARRIGIKIYIDLTTTHQPWIEHRGHVMYPLPTELERDRVQQELDKALARIAELEANLKAPGNGATAATS